MSLTLIVTPPPPIGNYSDLVAAVASALDRNNLNDRIPRFIQLAEATFNRRFRAPEMENAVLFEIDGDYPIPDDLLDIRNITLTTDPDNAFEQVTAARLVCLQRLTGRPAYYTQHGMALSFAPTPEARPYPYEAVISYYQRIQPLSVNIPTNWLLLQNPDLYYFGALVHAEAHLNNDERVSLWKAGMEEAAEEITQNIQRKKYGPTPLVMRTDVRQTCGRARI